WRPVSSWTVSTRLLLLREERLPRQPHSALLINLQQLHFDDVALLDHVLGLLGATLLNLADVQQALDPRHDFHERAEGGRALDRALVNLPHFRLFDHCGNHLAGLLPRL